MNSAQKAEFVESIRDRFDTAPFVALTDFRGSTAAEMNELRRACEAGGVGYTVVKNTLCRRALKGSEKEALSGHFLGNIGVVFSGEDGVAAAKLLKERVKANSKLVVKAGFFDGDVLDDAGVAAVADLPSKEELFSLLLRTIQEGPRQVMGVIRAPARDLLYLLSNYSAKLEENA